MRMERRDKKVDPNPMGGISLLESPRKYFGTVARSIISEGTSKKRKRRIRTKRMILIMSLKNLLKRMVEIPILHLWQLL
jgi:hypothetical protein